MHWKNLRDLKTEVVHAAVTAWTTKCGLDFMRPGWPKGAKTTNNPVTCQACRLAKQEAA